MTRLWMGLVITFLMTLNIQAKAKKKVFKVTYLKTPFAHIHQNPSRYSTSLTNFECGHPIKVLKEGSRTIFNQEWYKVRVAGYEGYMQISQLSNRRPRCNADKYPKFYNLLGLEVSDMYYWGKLYDMYHIGESKVK